MKTLITPVVCACLAIGVPWAVAMDPRPDDKLPVLKPKEIQHINPEWSGTSGVAFSPDGKRVVVTANGGYGPNGIFAVWDVETGKKLLEGDAFAGEKFCGGLGAVAWSPDGKVIATAGARAFTNPEDRGKAAVELWDAQTGKRIRRIERRAPSPEFSVAFSPDGKRILSGSGKVWDAETDKQILELKGHKVSVSSAKFSGDGKRIISMGGLNTVRLWDSETGKELLSLKVQGNDEFDCVAINRDGTRIVTGGSGKSVQFWDADTGKELRNFKDRLFAVAFHPNDKWVAGVVHDGFNVTAGTVKVWDITSGREVVSFRAHKEFPRNMAISSDGKRIAVCFDDGHVSVWSLNAEP